MDAKRRGRALGLVLLAAAIPARARDWSEAAAAPAYRAVEAVSDGLYGLLRGSLFTPLLPGRLSGRMSEAPEGTSYARFSAEFKPRQEHALRRIAESRPSGEAATPAALSDWVRAAFHHELSAAGDALAESLVARYQLERFGRDSGAYASDPRNWDPRFLASAGLLGGTYLYLAGLRADWTAGPLRVDLDTEPGAVLRGQFESGEGRVGSLRLSRRGSPCSLRSDWGLHGGRLAAVRVGVGYSRAF